MIQPLLELKNVSITRGERQVLCGINWSVNRNEHWVLMGPNGCGKTTMLEIISGYLWPKEGEVHLLGEKLGEVYLPDLRKKIGFVAPWVLGRIQDNVPVEDVVASGFDASIGYVGKISPKVKSQIHHQLKFFEATELYSRSFGQLSSGEKLKVILARSLVSKPHLLILDEPFSHLDLSSRYHCYNFLDKLSKTPQGPSIILVTHYLEDICPFFSHALLLKAGSIMVSGKKDMVITPELLSHTFHVSNNFKRPYCFDFVRC